MNKTQSMDHALNENFSNTFYQEISLIIKQMPASHIGV